MSPIKTSSLFVIFIHLLPSQLFASTTTTNNSQQHDMRYRFPAINNISSSKNILIANRQIVIDTVPLQSPTFYLADYPLKNTFPIHEYIAPDEASRIIYPWNNQVIMNTTPYSKTKKTDVTYSTNSQHINQVSLSHNSPDFVIQGRYLLDDGYKENTDRKLADIHFQVKQTFDNTTINHYAFLDSIIQNDVSFVVGNDAYKNKALDRLNPYSPVKNNAQQIIYFANIRHQPDNKKTLTVTPYIRLNQADALLSTIPGMPTQESASGSTGFISSFSRPYSETVELTTFFKMDYTYADYKQHQKTAYSTQYPAGSHYDFTTESFAFDWQLNIEQAISEKLSIIYNAQIEKTHYFNKNRLPDGSACVSGVSECMYYRPDQNQLNFLNFSPLVELRYDFSSNNQVALSAYERKRTPNGLDLYRLQGDQAIKHIKPQKTDAVELHFNGNIADRVHYQMLLFFRHIDHVIVSDTEGVYFYDQKIQSMGMESFSDFILTDELSITLALALNRTSYINGSYNTSENEGNDIKLLPQSAASIQLNWSPLENTQLCFEFQHLGRYYLDASNNKQYPGHQLINLYWQQSFFNSWHLLLAINNLTNTQYAEMAELTRQTSLNPIAQEQYIIGNPRSLTLGISKSF